MLSLSNFQLQCDGLSKASSGEGTPGSDYVKVTATQTSFWKRLFYKKQVSTPMTVRSPLKLRRASGCERMLID